MQQAACNAQEAATGAYEESNIHCPNPLHIGGMQQIRQRAARTAAHASGAKCCAVGAPEPRLDRTTRCETRDRLRGRAGGRSGIGEAGWAAAARQRGSMPSLQ